MLNEGIRAYICEGRPIVDIILSILSNYRSTVQSTITKSPSELMLGRGMRMPDDLLALSIPKKVQFEETFREHVRTQQSRYKKYYNDRHRTKESHTQIEKLCHISILLAIRDKCASSLFNKQKSKSQTTIDNTESKLRVYDRVRFFNLLSS